MGTEDQIREQLLQGNSPKSLIQNQKFKKSTVYKVYETVHTTQGDVNPHEWSFENIVINGQTQPRLMPGNTIRVSFSFRNNTQKDFYVVNLGVQPEWLVEQNQWISQSIKDLIKPGQSRYVTLSIAIPSDLRLGEYELTFGVEGQYLPVQTHDNQSLTTHWTNPIVLHVKKPERGIKIFFSHSIQDEYLVRDLEEKLDAEGIKVIIGEDEIQPGAYLPDKLKQMINSCNIFVVLLTHAANLSQWVNMEINYAIQLNKPKILLKESSVLIDTDYEWTEFSSSDSPDIILNKIITSINLVNPGGGGNVVAGIIGVGLLAVLLGALSNR